MLPNSCWWLVVWGVTKVLYSPYGGTYYCTVQSVLCLCLYPPKAYHLTLAPYSGADSTCLLSLHVTPTPPYLPYLILYQYGTLFHSSTRLSTLLRVPYLLLLLILPSASNHLFPSPLNLPALFSSLHLSYFCNYSYNCTAHLLFFPLRPIFACYY